MNNTMNQAHIDPTPAAGNEQQVQAIFDHVEKELGFVPDAVKLYGISPSLLETFISNVGYFHNHPSLSGELLAMIRYLVSAEADCQFCIDLNEGFLVNMGVNLDAVRAARQDADKAPLPDKEKALMKLAVRSVDDSKNIGKEDIAAANRLGWSDGEIFDAFAQAANNRALTFLLKSFNVHQQGTFA